MVRKDYRRPGIGTTAATGRYLSTTAILEVVAGPSARTARDTEPQDRQIRRTWWALSGSFLILAILADMLLKWRTDGEHDLLSVVLGTAGFALLPVTGLALVALPALDAHTRLLFGRSLAYQVTEKVSRPSTSSPSALARAMAPYN